MFDLPDLEGHLQVSPLVVELLSNFLNIFLSVAIGEEAEVSNFEVSGREDME